MSSVERCRICEATYPVVLNGHCGGCGMSAMNAGSFANPSIFGKPSFTRGTPPMNPHQKPQEDVVVTQEDIAEAEQWRFIEGRESEYEGDFVTDLAADFARHRLLGHEAGRRDMREAAGKVADAWLLSDYSEEANVMAQNIRDDIRALPTEPLGGESPQDNSGPE